MSVSERALSQSVVCASLKNHINFQTDGIKWIRKYLNVYLKYAFILCVV